MSCSKENKNIQILGVINDAKNSVVVIGEDPIHVDGLDMGAYKQFTISYRPYTEPTLSLTVTPATAEVGRTIASVNYQGSVVQGRDNLISKTISPQSIPNSEVDALFSFTLNNVFRNSKGLGGSHTITVNDGTDTYSITSGVQFTPAFYSGVSTEQPLQAATVNGFDKKLTPLQGVADYTITVDGQYIYWLQEENEEDLSGATLSGLPFPIQKESYQLQITNQYSISLTYNVFRSVNKFNVSTLPGIILE